MSASEVEEKASRASLAGFGGWASGCWRGVASKPTMEKVGWFTTAAAVGLGVYYGWKGARALQAKWQEKRRKPEMVVPSAVMLTERRPGSHAAETARLGSEERPMTQSRSQCLVGYVEGERFMALGNAVRMDRWLLIPDHVKCAVGAGTLELRGNDGQKLNIDREISDRPEFGKFYVLDTDLLVLEMSEAEFSKVGLAKCRALPAIPEQKGSYCSVVGAFGKGTTGNLTHSTIFGQVNYTGSTFQGYSGAGYFAGSQLAGIHIHGGVMNGGYSASYLWAEIHHLWKVKPEDSSAWLEEEIKKGADVKVDPRWHDVDEKRIRVNGRYHIVSADTLTQVYGDEWYGKARKNKGQVRFFEDAEAASTASGEETDERSGASSSSSALAPLREELVQSLTNGEFRKLKRLLSGIPAKPLTGPTQG